MPSEDMFYMDKDGSIFVKQPTLDREVSATTHRIS